MKRRSSLRNEGPLAFVKANLTTFMDCQNTLAGGIRKTTIIVCPPYTALTGVVQSLKNSNIAVGAQNMFFEKQGAYTGEISADMIKSTGATYVILGHSERRQYFGETDESINKKLKMSLAAGLLPIICVGETLDQREVGVTNEIISSQLRGAFEGISDDEMEKVIIAYEPVWAIGTGKTATPVNGARAGY